ncbi:hypothetical protein QUV83_08015 [Cellulomonas cellasea]|uniref:hypothetical protein n=1 Tax=Cellulomonas cellasea TaxID=43670 RepID=UPI0025A4623F|nr:hypothetical protein [Cellulomonas cellasea]MDM8084704.1 hypothetical protein [Cellulomonas cellasea]
MPTAAVATPRQPYPWALVLAVFLAVSAALTAVVAWSERHRPPGDGSILQGPSWLDGWFQYDAGWYHHIATAGYQYVPGQQSSIAFFPVYPMGVRALANVTGDVQVAGSLLAVLAGGAAVLLFGRWAWARLPRPAALTAIAVLMLYPYAFFLYGAMYADSLFLLCAVGAFLLLERRWYWAAGLVGALATAGRPVGVAVAVGLVVRTVELLAQDRAKASGDVDAGPRGWRELVRAVRDVRWRHAGVLLSGAGLAAWCAYLWIEFGNPLAFVEVESAPGWNQGVGPKTWFKVVYAGTLVKGPYDVAALLTLQAVACLLAVLLLRRVWRRFGWGYLAYTFVVLLIPILGTKDFMGTGRYVLVAFPAIAAAGDFLTSSPRRWLRPAVLLVSAVLLVLLTSLFGRSVAVS